MSLRYCTTERKDTANVKESRTRGEFAREFEAAGGREELAR